jgi:excisionase family DNA binding protein
MDADQAPVVLPPEVLTPEQVAEFLSVSVSTVYRELRAGRLPGIKVGQQWRTARSVLLDRLAGGTQR